MMTPNFPGKNSLLPDGAVSVSPYLCVVVPLYNEEGCLENLVGQILQELKGLSCSFEILFVDDGSQDRTFETAAKLAQRFPALRVVKFRKNYGQTAAMAAGFEHARGEVIVTMDGDLQNDPADIPRLLAKMEEGFDLVSGWRKDRQDTYWTRILPSKIANALISLFTGVPLHDYGCSLKAYRAKFVKGLPFYSDMHRFFPAMVATLAGARVAEIPVNHRPRLTGKSKYGLSRIFLVLADLITILMITRFSKKPLYWFGLLGLPCLMAGGFLLAMTLLYYHNMAQKPLVIFPGTALLVLALGFHFLLQGLLSEYILHAAGGEQQDVLCVTIDHQEDDRIG